MRQLETPRDLTALDALVSPFGLVSRTGELSATGRPKAVRLWKAEGGAPDPRRLGRTDEIIGGGYGWDDPDLARFIAIAEAAERYAGRDVLGEHRVLASAHELAGECLEPERYPRCSASEYAHPACPVVPFDPGAVIRWTSGLDLISREPTWVPSVMACYGLADTMPAERFCDRLSTGFAVHPDPVEAVVRGIFEAIERDANAVLWLQRLPLPLLDPAHLGERVAWLIEWCRLRFMEVRVFDSTTDLGVPTAFCVISAEHDRRAHRVVGAGCGRDLPGAAYKALLEALSTPTFIRFEPETAVPDSLDRMHAAGDTTRYMGRAEHGRAFDFLLSGTDRPPSVVRPPLPADPATTLAELLTRLAVAGMRPVVVDRTPGELADVGLTAVNVVIPDLQPMSLVPLAQFTAHPRLYEVPARMGYRVLSEAELNPWPQPMG